MKLAFCIPTHHGRVDYLRQLIESILRQSDLPDPGQLQICVSDNASNDGTAEMMADYQRTCRIAVKYFRFPEDMRGVINTTNVIEMADTEYCWLLGSDDVIIDGGVARVLAGLQQYPQAAGVTVNKLNYDRSLKYEIGPDHPIVLPKNPKQSRLIDNPREGIVALGMLFSYMSAHIFRRDAWRAVVQNFGMPYLKTTRHFSHAFMFLQMLKEHGMWLWIAEYSVIQRMGNFCLMEEKEGRTSLYHSEILTDIEKVWASVAPPDSPEYQNLMKRHFLPYWNPFQVRRFKCEQGLTREEERALLALTNRCFRRVPLYWLTSYLILLMPGFIIRPTVILDYVIGEVRRRQIGVRPLVRAGFWLVSVENSWTRRFDAARAIARSHEKQELIGA